MECIRITEDTLKWFLPIIRPDIQERLSQDPNTFAIGAVCDKTACGIVVYEVSDVPIIPDDEFEEELEDGSIDEDGSGIEKIDEREREMQEDGSEMIQIVYLAVSDCYRRRGVATALIDTLIDCARDPLSGIFAYFSASGEEDPLYLFFADYADFSIEERDEYICRISHDMLAENSQLMSYRKKATKCEEFFSISPVMQKDFRQKIGEDAEYVFGNAKYVEPLCLCVRDSDCVRTAVFFEKYGENDLYLSYAYSESGNEAKLIGILAEAAGRALENNPSADLYIAAVTPSAVSITDKLFPHREITKHFYLTTWDMD